MHTDHRRQSRRQVQVRRLVLDAEGEKFGEIHYNPFRSRITSYNVCYTKLLRAGPGKVRINQAGCLDRCEEGPCMVVYPEAVWYTYVDRADIDEIIEEHLRDGRVVERLRI